MTRRSEYLWRQMFHYTTINSATNVSDVPPQPRRLSSWSVTITVLTRYSPVLDTRTATLNIKKFHILPTECISESCMNLERNSDYLPLYTINWLVF